MNFRQSGLILFSTLAMIIIISLLLLSQMQQIMLYAKALGQQNHSAQRLLQMEAIAEKLVHDKTLTDNWDCMLEQDEPNAILDLVEKRGCKVNGNAPYQFLIEDLGIVDCLLIREKSGIFASHHRRFSLIQNEEEEKNYLQIRQIEASVSKGSCSKSPKIIEKGLVGWRYGRL